MGKRDFDPAQVKEQLYRFQPSDSLTICGFNQCNKARYFERASALLNMLLLARSIIALL